MKGTNQYITLGYLQEYAPILEKIKISQNNPQQPKIKYNQIKEQKKRLEIQKWSGLPMSLWETKLFNRNWYLIVPETSITNGLPKNEKTDRPGHDLEESSPKNTYLYLTFLWGNKKIY